MVAILKRTKREPGEPTPAEFVKQRKIELQSARQRNADADAALKRAQAAHQRVTAEAERDEAAHVAEMEQARDTLAVALADDGDTDKARKRLDELNAATQRRREEAGILSTTLERRRNERKESDKRVRQAERAYWMAVERCELAKVPDLDALKRAFVACKRASPVQIAGFEDYLSDLLGPMAQSQIAAVYDALEADYGK